jgi:hypothetical protein
VNCAHAIHTTTARTFSNVSTVIGARSVSELGTPCGNGQPNTRASPSGTPPTSASSATSAASARTTSPAVRFRRAGGGGAATPCPAVRGSPPAVAGRPPRPVLRAAMALVSFGARRVGLGMGAYAARRAGAQPVSTSAVPVACTVTAWS